MAEGARSGDGADSAVRRGRATMNGGLRLLRSLAAGCALGVAGASGAVRVIGEDGYDPARGVIANLDAIVRAAFAETNACIIVTPVPRGL
ncbi:MAG: hypothetical protein PUJ80_04310, partial [Verrucomicrobiota bacterium]|nr:hypothetical protein [Verrucomicrobiota bacterium]